MADVINKRLLPPDNGVTVRMYRTGHGDCFLLAFPGEKKVKPVYVLIDCGYKPGSPQKLSKFQEGHIRDIGKSIFEATGGRVDVVVITHEHQDHLNGITAKNFPDLAVGQVWLAWTEDPADELANSLRQTYKDRLVGLLAARNRLAAAGDEDQVQQIDDLLEFELGGDDDDVFSVAAISGLFADGSVAGDADGKVGEKVANDSMNKRSMRLFKDRAEIKPPNYIKPHQKIMTIPGAKDLRIFALGPPKDEEKLRNLNPEGTEEFHFAGLPVSPAVDGVALERNRSPFANRYSIPLNQVGADYAYAPFFTLYYGNADAPQGQGPHNDDEVTSNPDWRRIDREWLYSAKQLALDMSNFTNNASLVLAFELGKGGKVLLFAADAQRGNWASWAEGDWKEGDTTVTTRDLLARTVLYKVGHHGSHNATLNGSITDPVPNLGWMATGAYQGEFTAMITAVRAWAETQKGWDHPLKAIKDSLLKKASGRVLQTDTEIEDMQKPENASPEEWERFLERAKGERLYFDYTVTR